MNKSLEPYKPPKASRRFTILLTAGCIIGIVVILGVCYLLAKYMTGAPNGSTLSQQGAPVSAIGSPPAPPSETPKPSPSPAPQNRPVVLGKPQWIAVHRGQSVIVSRTKIGEAYKLPDGHYRSPGNGLAWTDDSSGVGSGMKRSAIIVGESRFEGLASVRPGDTIEVEAPAGAVTFVVDAVKVPYNQVSHTAGTLQIALCACGGGRDRVISAHVTS